MDVITLHASQAHEWTECSQRAQYFHNLPERPASESIGVIFGSMVHQQVTGHVYERPATIKYDQTTPTPIDLDIQTNNIATAIQDLLAAKQLEIVHNEQKLEATAEIPDLGITVHVVGTIDLICRQGETMVLLDLKTGRSPAPHTFQQIAVYVWLYAQHYDSPPAQAGFLFAPRGKGIKAITPKTILDLRPAPPLLGIARDLFRARALTARYGNMYNPGMYCAYCPSTIACPVRPRREP